MQKSIKATLYSLVGIFILLLVYFMPIEFSLKQKFFPIVAVLGLSFLILGIMLIVLSRKEKGRLKFFLILTGASAIAPLVFTILHNLFYGLAITFEKLHFIFEPLHVFSFIASLIIAPILFIIGIAGIIILSKGGNRQSHLK